MSHADSRRMLRVRGNADTLEDSQRARRMGAEGIGLCRTEHMFLGDRRRHVERLVLAEDGEQRQQALDALLPLQREDFLGIFGAMNGLPVMVRLLDPPLHEFCPTTPSCRCGSRSPRNAVSSRAPTPNCLPRYDGCTRPTR